VDSVGLDDSLLVDEAGIDHGDEGDVVLGGEFAEDFFEFADVVGAVVGGQGDAGQEDLDVGGFEGGEDEIEVAAGFGEGQATEAVVATKLYDNDGGVEEHNCLNGGGGVFGGGSAGALIEDLVVVVGGVELALKKAGVVVAGGEAKAGGDAVAEADEDGWGGGLWRGCLGNFTAERGGQGCDQ